VEDYSLVWNSLNSLFILYCIIIAYSDRRYHEKLVNELEEKVKKASPKMRRKSSE
jgi:uncharacterized membrane protein